MHEVPPDQSLDAEPTEPAFDEYAALQGVAAAAVALAAARAELDRQVLEAHDNGVSWRRIARTLGIAPNTALRRWDSAANASARAYAREKSYRLRHPTPGPQSDAGAEEPEA